MSNSNLRPSDPEDKIKLLQTVTQQTIDFDERRWNKDVPIVGDTNVAHFAECEKQNSLTSGLVMEFGVFDGGSTVALQDRFKTKTYGFDSFKGLPEDDGYFKMGEFDLGGVVPARLLNLPNIEIVAGWFDDTLPIFVQQHPEHVRMVSIDCDTYIGAKAVFTHLKDRFVKGTTIYFDEFREAAGYWGWELREYRAFLEFIQETGFDYKYIAKAPDGGRVSVLLLGKRKR
jgi:hypothetical protein